MRNLVKRSRFSGYKGMERIGRESKQRMKELENKSSEKEYWMYTFDEYFDRERPNLPDNGKYAEERVRQRFKEAVKKGLEPHFIYGQQQGITFFECH